MLIGVIDMQALQAFVYREVRCKGLTASFSSAGWYRIASFEEGSALAGVHMEGSGHCTSSLSEREATSIGPSFTERILCLF